MVGVKRAACGLLEVLSVKDFLLLVSDAGLRLDANFDPGGNGSAAIPCVDQTHIRLVVSVFDVAEATSICFTSFCS